MSKKHKFDLTKLVHQGFIKDGETLYFVSDPTKTCKVYKMPNGEYKVQVGKIPETVHHYVTQLLGQEPPNHAAYWLKTSGGKTLYELWHAEDDDSAMAA